VNRIVGVTAAGEDICLVPSAQNFMRTSHELYENVTLPSPNVRSEFYENVVFRPRMGQEPIWWPFRTVEQHAFDSDVIFPTHSIVEPRRMKKMKMIFLFLKIIQVTLTIYNSFEKKKITI
jgi:hypothetical protein